MALARIVCTVLMLLFQPGPLMRRSCYVCRLSIEPTAAVHPSRSELSLPGSAVPAEPSSAVQLPQMGLRMDPAMQSDSQAVTALQTLPAQQPTVHMHSGMLRRDEQGWPASAQQLVGSTMIAAAAGVLTGRGMSIRARQASQPSSHLSLPESLVAAVITELPGSPDGCILAHHGSQLVFVCLCERLADEQPSEYPRPCRQVYVGLPHITAACAGCLPEQLS